MTSAATVRPGPRCARCTPALIEETLICPQAHPAGQVFVRSVDRRLERPDQFGACEPPLAHPVESVHRLAEARRVLRDVPDDDVVPFGPTPRRATASSAGSRPRRRDRDQVEMVTTNTFSHPIFKDGAFTSNDRRVRRYGLRKSSERSTSPPSSAHRPSSCGRPRGCRVRLGQDLSGPRQVPRGIDTVAGYIKDKGYDLRIAIEPKPNEPRGDICSRRSATRSPSSPSSSTATSSASTRRPATSRWRA